MIDVNENADCITHSKFAEHHSNDWEHCSHPTQNEIIQSLKNECNSWLGDLGVNINIGEIE